ncbi:MAG: NHLP bacteriocin export ABC transporter permease/ATPase subunit [Acidobacteriaceae bacterium]|nr:NHLP bacteriocin export ABC transporter permease/ATPase subunit [Acidobacteriaceae bacterium]
MDTLTPTRFLLDGEGEAWRIERGTVDLFLVDVDHAGQTGPLFHSTTLEAGTAIFAVGKVVQTENVATLLCQARAGAVVTPLLQPQEDEIAEWKEKLAVAAGLEKDPEASLDALHYILLQTLITRRDNHERDESLRLKDKERHGQSAVSRALLELGSVLSTHEDRDAVIADERSAVFAACRFLGHHAGIEMRAAKSFRASDDPLRDVASIARASGVRHREVLLRNAWWKQDHGPLLAFLAESDEATPTPVALLRETRSYRIYDPAKGTVVPLSTDVAAKLLPDAVMFYRPFPSRAIDWKDLLRFGLFGTRKDTATILTVGIVSGLLALVTPIATGILFDTIIPSAQRPQLYQMAVLLFTTNMVGFLISLTSSIAMQRMEGRMEGGIQSAVWDRLLSLPVRFFRDYSSGDLVNRSLAIGQIRQMLTGTALSTILSGIFSIFSFFLLFRYSMSMALVACVLVVITAAFSALCGYLQMRFQRQIYEIAGKISGLTLEIMNGIAKLRMSGTESHGFARWATEFARQKNAYSKAARVNIAIDIFNGVFPSIAGIAIFYYGFEQMTSSAGLTPGSFVAFNAAFGQFLGSALGLTRTLVSIIGIIPAYERAAPIMKAIPESNESRYDPGRLRGAIEASRLRFRYKEDLPIVLNDVSFTINPGEFVAFVGHSGSGKSTLFRLLLGFEKPESGFIHFDGLDLDDIDPQAVRRQMGVVLQNGRITDGDLFTNIIGSAPLSIEDAWEAARAAGLDKDIEAMPMGMHTIISEGGGGLSGGQRQRLLIARAIVHRPRILLFDEATSALDNQTQATVSRSLEQLNATRIVIAHRLSTILHADRIFVFDQGRIVQQGTYDELMTQEGLFRDLAQRQIA